MPSHSPSTRRAELPANDLGTDQGIPARTPRTCGSGARGVPKRRPTRGQRPSYRERFATRSDESRRPGTPPAVRHVQRRMPPEARADPATAIMAAVVTATAVETGHAPHGAVDRPNLVSIGTIVWLASELMFFAALFAMYFTI